MKKGLLFDLDGTLWDATATLVAPWNTVLHRFGYLHPPLTRQDMVGFMGKTAAQIGQMLLPDDPETGRRICMESCEVELPDLREKGGVLYPQLTETLDALRRQYHLYIVSNCQEGYIQAFLAHHQLGDRFEDFEYEGRTRLTKGENIRLVAQRNGLDCALYVGDTQSDMDAADAAGLPFVHASYGFGTVNRETPVLHTFAELPAIADALL